MPTLPRGVDDTSTLRLGINPVLQNSTSSTPVYDANLQNKAASALVELSSTSEYILIAVVVIIIILLVVGCICKSGKSEDNEEEGKKPTEGAVKVTEAPEETTLSTNNVLSKIGNMKPLDSDDDDKSDHDSDEANDRRAWRRYRRRARDYSKAKKAAKRQRQSNKSGDDSSDSDYDSDSDSSDLDSDSSQERRDFRRFRRRRRERQQEEWLAKRDKEKQALKEQRVSAATARSTMSGGSSFSTTGSSKAKAGQYAVLRSP